MAEDDKDSKTEEPTERKLEKAAEEGSFASSQEIKSLGALFGALLMVGVFAPAMMRDISGELAAFIENGYQIPITLDNLRFSIGGLLFQVGLYMALPIFLAVLFALMATVSQQRKFWTPKKLVPDFKKFSPAQGAKKLASVKQFVEFLKGVLKIGIVLGVLWLVLWPQMDVIPNMSGRPLMASLDKIQSLIVTLLVTVLIVMVFVAAIDYIYQRFEFLKQQRMTKQQVKDENKNTQGDPQIKSRIAQIRNERARQRMMAAVPKADVVVTNPTHFACALQYEYEEMAAPVLVAKGVDDLAMRIREVAEEHDIPVVENPPLARALYATVELDQEVPPEHYKAVAEVIGYVMRLKGKLPG